MVKTRLDVLLVEKGLFPTRAKAQAAVMAGLILVDGQKVDKAGALVKPIARVEIKGDICPYVSRGGLKMEGALKELAIDPEGLVCLDIGASTGGFTDCLLQKGAREVFAVDVGYGQLAWRLRQDERVIALEKTNARYLKLADLKKAKLKVKPDDIFEMPELAVMDVSFISILKIFQIFKDVLSPEGRIVSLIKPQFEAGRTDVEKGGLVKNQATHKKILIKIAEGAARLGFILEAMTFSSIKGADGNIEYFGLWSKAAGSFKIDVEKLVTSAFKGAK